MKKTISVILILALMFCFGACGKKNTGSTDDPAAGVSGQSESTQENAAQTTNASTTKKTETTKAEDTTAPENAGEENETDAPAGNDAETQTQAPVENTKSRTLVAYFSPDNDEEKAGEIENGNTRIVAQMIADTLNADLFAITPTTAYPTSYDELSLVPLKETRNPPAVSGRVDSIRDYDTVYVGYPIWYGDMPAIVEVFLSSYDLYGITVIPFCTHSGSGLGSTPAAISALCSGSPVGKGLAVLGSDALNDPDAVRSQVKSWLAEKTADTNAQERG